MRTPQPIIYIVICTLALIVLGIVTVMCLITWFQVPTAEPFGVLKDVLLTSLGALVGLLVNTRSAPASDETKTDRLSITTAGPVAGTVTAEGGQTTT